MACRVCGGEIHPERRAIQPRVVTCSHACSEAWKKRINRLAAQRYRARRRGAEPGATPPGTGAQGQEERTRRLLDRRDALARLQAAAEDSPPG